MGYIVMSCTKLSPETCFIINTISQFQLVFSNSEQKAISSSPVKPWPCCSLKSNGWNICTVYHCYPQVSSHCPSNPTERVWPLPSTGLHKSSPILPTIYHYPNQEYYVYTSQPCWYLSQVTVHGLIQRTTICGYSLCMHAHEHARKHARTHINTNTPQPEEPSSILVVPYIICNIFGCNSAELLTVFPTAWQENEVAAIHINCSWRQTNQT
jgi:hypothetical protein